MSPPSPVPADHAPRTGAVLALVANALVWGLSWIAFKALHAHGLHPLWSTALVYAGALAALLAWRPGSWRAFWRQPQLLALAAAAGLTNVGFNWAVTLGGLAGALPLAALAAGAAGWLPWALGLTLAFLGGNLALQYGAARLPAQVTALIMLAEVVFASGSAMLLGAATPTPWTWAGGALILLAALLSVVPGIARGARKPQN